MKKIILGILTMCVLPIFAQNQEVVYESIYLIPEKAKELKLVEGVKKHNEKFHSEGKTTASLYSVLIGRRSGQYVWLNGPMGLSDYDAMPNEVHMADWQKNVRNNVSSESVVLGKLNWDASYTPPSWGNPKYLLHRTIKIGRKYGSYGKVLEAVTKIGKVLNQINAPNPRRVYQSVFNDENGENITLVYPFKSFTRFNQDNGLPANFQQEYEKINGLGSFRRDIWDVLSEYSEGQSDEVLQLIN